ncbi:MAG: HlyD family efflux transporter periplasmic adaptor subunit [Treponema sp.]|uniref:HlyD family secretion protein n=1 Tax=Treponema sp. TaxID=166 RepID=UPI002A91BD8A|nr:HlyD family efflux transporter periplasmic adaptor subunit [Treponema sp.]MDY6396409.1 HlyD family efflux transporter periplasmic adaptor subunit [Treponema sp.]
MIEKCNINEKIKFVSEKELTSSRIYYELKTPSIVIKSLAIITSFFMLSILYIVFVPYDVVVKAPAVIRPVQDVAYITNLVNGTIKEKCFSTGDKIEQGQILYIFENDYIYKGIEAAESQKKEINEILERDNCVLNIIEGYEKKSDSFEKLSSCIAVEVLKTEVKKLEMEYIKASSDYERELDLLPSYTSKLNVENCKKLRDDAKLNLESYLNGQKKIYSEEKESKTQELNELESTISKLNADLSNTIIKSPIEGFAEVLNETNRGESIVAETRLAKIIPKDDGRIKAYIQIPIEDIAELETKMPFTLTFAKYPTAEYRSIMGKIDFIPKDSKLQDNGTAMYQVVGLLDTNKLERRRNGKEVFLVPGMSATCKILTRKEPLYLFLLEKVGI